MAEIRRLKNPPIKEAIFQIAVEKNPAVHVEFQEVKDLALKGIWKKKKRFEATIEVAESAESAQTTMTEPQLDGYTLFSPDDKVPSDVWEFDFKAFTYHKLPSYSDFDDCLDVLKDQWSSYVRIFQPLSIKSTSLRFLNSIRIPPPVQFEFHEYFNPDLPVAQEWIDLSIKSFEAIKTQIAFTLEDGNSALVSLALREIPVEECNDITLDLKVNSNKVIGLSDWDALEANFRTLRTLKNQIFFGSVTEKTLALFD